VKGRGLTLVELLIALAVVALLAALLVPAGIRAAEEANLTECRANLRTVGQAVLLHAKDHEGSLPVSDVLDGPHPALLAALGLYLDDPRVYYCPSTRDPDHVFTESNLAAGRIGYFYFSCERGTPNRLISTFLRWNVEWPRRLHHAMPGETWVASDRWLSGESTAHAGYKKCVNYVTLAGEVRMITEGPRAAFK